MRSTRFVVLAVAGLVACGGRAPAPSPIGGRPAPEEAPAAPVGRACPERYDDTTAERASAELVAVGTELLARARGGDHRALEGELATGAAVSAMELHAALRGIPASCAIVWYAQPGRFAVPPRLEGEPADPARDALADAIDAADQIVATCDGGCGVVALAIAPSTHAVVSAMPISQRPGNLH